MASDFYVPSSKKELIKMLAPVFPGDPARLKRMDKKQLYAIFYKHRRSVYANGGIGDNNSGHINCDGSLVIA